jgi:hypothetical protein
MLCGFVNSMVRLLLHGSTTSVFQPFHWLSRWVCGWITYVVPCVFSIRWAVPDGTKKFQGSAMLLSATTLKVPLGYCTLIKQLAGGEAVGGRNQFHNSIRHSLFWLQMSWTQLAICCGIESRRRLRRMDLTLWWLHCLVIQIGRYPEFCSILTELVTWGAIHSSG